MLRYKHSSLILFGGIGLKPAHFLFSLSLTLSLSLFILSFSIALPIYIRPVYYAYSELSGLAEHTGYEKEKIKEAYDSVLDYLTIPGKEFSIGDMRYTESAKSHFKDCKKLFFLNTSVLIFSLFLSLFLLYCSQHKPRLSLYRRKSFFHAGICALTLPSIIGFTAVISFDFAFTLFHKLFFPGKSNWVFNRYTDEIINILPQGFFALCGAVIGISVLTLSIAAIFYGKKK